MKKYAALAGAGALLLSMAGSALGFFSNDVSIWNVSTLKNYTTTKAYSGDNDMGGKYVFGGSIVTGAAGAMSTVLNDVNGSLVDCVGCWGDTSIWNMSYLKNKTYTKADSGDNHLGGKCLGGGTIRTGAASAVSGVTNYVNQTLVGGMTP